MEQNYNANAQYYRKGDFQMLIVVESRKQRERGLAYLSGKVLRKWREGRVGSTGHRNKSGIGQIISFFSYNCQFYLCIIILMSFSNFLHPLYPLPFYIQTPLPPLPFFTYTIDSPLPSIKPEQSVATAESAPSQQIEKGVDFEVIEERLKKMHFESEHHRKTHWTAEEDKLLGRLVQVQKLEWKEIPKHFADRTQNMCYSRYRRISMCTRDRSWSSEEEQLVLALVRRFGEKWKSISSKMPKFTPKQIRERYLNYLRPISKQDFTLEEDLKICRYVLAHGKHWRRMEEVLPGRSEGCIKGRYYGKLQKIMTQPNRLQSI